MGPAADQEGITTAADAVAVAGHGAASKDASGAPAAVARPSADTASDASAASDASNEATQPKAGASVAETVRTRTAALIAVNEQPKSHITTVAQAAPLPAAPSPAGSIGGALFALVLVVGLILALAWLARRMPGVGAVRGNAALRVVGSLALGPRERVVVVAVGETQLLLGVGAGGTRTLHTLDVPLPEPAARNKITPGFAQLLAQHLGKKA